MSLPDRIVIATRESPLALWQACHIQSRLQARYPGLVVELANHLSPSRLQAILGDVCHIREQLMSVTGINRELLITDLLLRIEHYLQPGVVLPVPHL